MQGKSEPEPGQQSHEGVVVGVAGATYRVKEANGSTCSCRTTPVTRSGNPEASLVAVGDTVEFRPSGDGEGVITAVRERESALCRSRDVRRNRSKERVQVIAANIDRLVVIVSATNPPLSPRLIDRYLVFAESEGIEPVVVVNKMDLDPAGESQRECERYLRLGYRVIHVSAADGTGLDELRHELREGISAFSGHSGVGKSTLINRLLGREELRTARTSYKSGKGVHTTSSATMLELEGGGYVIDTPGIREFSLAGIDRGNLRFFFPEFLPLMPSCAFSSCSHTVEPGCAVTKALEAGELDPSRYESYLLLYEALQD